MTIVGLDQRITFKCDANLKQFHNLVDRQIRNDRPAIGHERNEALGFQLLERFPHGDTTCSEPLRQLVLPELKSGRKLAQADREPQRLTHGVGRGPVTPGPSAFCGYSKSHPAFFSAFAADRNSGCAAMYKSVCILYNPYV